MWLRAIRTSGPADLRAVPVVPNTSDHPASCKHCLQQARPAPCSLPSLPCCRRWHKADTPAPRWPGTVEDEGPSLVKLLIQLRGPGLHPSASRIHGFPFSSPRHPQARGSNHHLSPGQLPWCWLGTDTLLCLAGDVSMAGGNPGGIKHTWPLGHQSFLPLPPSPLSPVSRV